VYGDDFYCRDVYSVVGLVSVRARLGRVNVGTCSAKSGYCWDVFGNVGLVSGHVLRGRVIVGMCSGKSA